MGSQNSWTPTTAGIPTGSQQNKSGVIVGHRKDADFPNIALYIVFRNRSRTIVDTVAESALFIVQREQGLVEGTVQDPLGTPFRYLRNLPRLQVG